MWDFHRRFLDQAWATFDADPDCGFVAWVEDDCRFNPGESMSTMLAQLESAVACVHWLGYICVKGVPWWASHLVVISRKGLPIIKAHMDMLGRTSGHVKYLMGLDTFIRKLGGLAGGDMDLLHVAPHSLARQHKHKLQGRR